MPNQGYTYQKDQQQKKKEDQVKNVDLYLGVLFDGTNNNEYNIDIYNDDVLRKWITEELELPTPDSALQGYSNVARFHHVYKEDNSNKAKLAASVYIQGVGTSLWEDSRKQGQGFGKGPMGINAKVQDGCVAIVKKINYFAKKVIKKPCKITLHLSVIGFSRGAATARRFITSIDKTSGEVDSSYNECLSDHLKEHFKKKGLVRDVKVQVPFAGLFDTVSSYGYRKTIFSISDNVKELGLSLTNSKAKNIVQLCAADEYRKHFSLTTTGKGIEYIIPGAHSDVGGGCKEEDEIWQETERPSLRNGFKRKMNGFKTKDELKAEGWFTQADIDKKQRKVYPDYCLIPFDFMLKYLKQYNNGCTIIDSAKLSNLKYKTVPSDLAQIKNLIMAKKEFYKFEGSKKDRRISAFNGNEAQRAIIAKVRNKYLHLSAKGGMVNGPAKSNVRIIVDGK